MEIQPYDAAKAAFALKDLSVQKMSFTNAYRVKRNLDHLGHYADKYAADLGSPKSQLEYLEKDLEVKQKWQQLEKEEVKIMLLELHLEGPEFQVSADILNRISFMLKEPENDN